MPVVITTLAGGEALTATRLNGIFEEVQNYLNGNIEASDISSSANITEREIIKPEFYGSPAPRALLATSDVHYRRELDYTRTQIYTNQMSTGFVPIPGMSATFYCEKACQAIVTATFKAAERLLRCGSAADRNGTVLTLPLDLEISDNIAAEFRAFVNGTAIKGTKRVIYSSQDTAATAAEDLTAKNLSICCMVDLSAGLNDVSIRVKPSPDGNGSHDEFFHIYVSYRQMHIEALIK